MRLPQLALSNPALRVAVSMLACVWLASCASLSTPGATTARTSEPKALVEDGPFAAEPLLPAKAGTPVDTARGDPRIERALAALGTRYRYGGNTPESGFDCSGLVRWVYQDIAAQLPRSAQALSQVEAPEVERDALQPGDLLFFRINRSRAITHVGMYMGNGQFIHAPSSGARVRVESMETPYWRARLVKARRWALPAKSASAPLCEGRTACRLDDPEGSLARPRLAYQNPRRLDGKRPHDQWNPTPTSASFRP